MLEHKVLPCFCPLFRVREWLFYQAFETAQAGFSPIAPMGKDELRLQPRRNRAPSGNGGCAICKKGGDVAIFGSVIQFMNAIVKEQKTAFASLRPVASKPREKPERKPDTPPSRENGIWPRLAKLLEQRVAPQHWGINE